MYIFVPSSTKTTVMKTHFLEFILRPRRWTLAPLKLWNLPCVSPHPYPNLEQFFHFTHLHLNITLTVWGNGTEGSRSIIFWSPGSLVSLLCWIFFFANIYTTLFNDTKSTTVVPWSPFCLSESNMSEIFHPQNAPITRYHSLNCSWDFDSLFVMIKCRLANCRL